MNRRLFLSAGTSFVVSAQTPPASDRVRLAVIGMGGRGSELMRVFSKVPGTEIAAVVDPDTNRGEAAATWLLQNTGQRALVERDMRRVFDDKNVDAVIVTNTNHWHALTAIWAMQAGKHVYVEKPVSHNIFEGSKMVEAARKYDRIVQGGTQRRSSGRMRKAMQMLHDGIIGDIYLAKWSFAGRRDSIGFKPVEEPPSWLDWDLWLGPAQQQPFHRNLVHYNWHWFWDFGGGELANNGPHFVDVARWGIQRELPVKIHCWGGRFGYKDQAQTPNTQSVTWIYGDGAAIVGELRGLYTGEQTGWDFFGSKGHMHFNFSVQPVITLGRNKQPEPPVEMPKEGDSHYANFVEAVRTRNRALLNAEVRETHLSTALCHLGNIAYRVGREVRFDPKRERFIDAPDADKLLTRDYRKPYVVPERL